MTRRSNVNIDILTIFPEMIEAVCSSSILGRAADKGILNIRAVNIRDFSENRHHKTDDAPFGGGAGMVMTPQPVFDALHSIQAENKTIVYLSPKGERADQSVIQSLAQESDLVFLCGHYEGVDERILDYWHPKEISIGDYILTGGELAAMVLVDAVARLLPGVLGNADSAMEESVYSGLLEYPQYTRPREYEGMAVPETLLSGDHRAIELWRYRTSLSLTREKRPDLWENYLATVEPEQLSREERTILADISGEERFRPVRKRKKHTQNR